MKVEIRTKRPAQYFSGSIQKGYFPMEGEEFWFVSCESCAGGSRKVNLLSVLDYKEKKRTELFKRLRRLSTRGKYLIRFYKG